MSQRFILGIRHHGPGSAKRLLKSLKKIEPDCLLIEAPIDGGKYLSQINTPGLRAPVALLMYNPKEFSQASYLPFAAFSPEWEAIQYALKKDIPIRAMDLAMGIQMELEREKQMLPLMGPPTAAEDKMLIQDPLGFIANLAGYDDSERWWEHTFEQEENDLAVFEAVLDMMSALREETADYEKRETLLREAHMRKIIRKSIKEGFQRIAIVCGAWHGPPLQDIDKFKASSDNKLLRGLKKVSLKACWIPWSYDRLAKQSGYGAGVISPAWYEMIYNKRGDSSIRWMSKAARLFRKEELDASAANVIEAVRLAETLATIRGLQLPGIEELEEAALSVLCEGNQVPLALIRERLIIGDTVGKVPVQLSNIPLQKDFEAQVKKARLSSSYNSSEQISKELDFRKSTQKLASILLHRLLILGIPWGTLRKTSKRDLGSFKEKWKLKWRPDYSIRIIQAGMYGNTLAAATHHFALQEAANKKKLPELLHILDQLLKAELGDTATQILPLIQDMAAQSEDVLELAGAVPNLVNMLRYGSTQKADTEAIAALLEAILPRIFIGLARACRHLEEDPAREIFRHILNLQSNISLINEAEKNKGWQTCLLQILKTDHVHPLIQGITQRILFDNNQFPPKQMAINMELALSIAISPSEKAMWLEGFLHGNALLLVYHPALWNILDNWIKGLAEERFFESLPILRRTFANFSKSERSQLFELAEGKKAVAGATSFEVDEDRLDILLPFLEKFLG